MKLFKEVEASERLPDSLKVVTAYYDDNTFVTFVFYNEDEKAWYYAFEPDEEDQASEPDSWLEPFEIDEDKIVDILATYEKEWDNEKGEFLPLDVFQKDKIKAAAIAIKQLLE
ncbi:hypothetical protein LCGC14_1350550 [marine sediment metagenome]|uniref:Uncharacterized protein n=1 Tax=marine sediment metagenome TaxID=412755 RepID=A0A0F9KB63_9ZZZZ